MVISTLSASSTRADSLRPCWRKSMFCFLRSSLRRSDGLLRIRLDRVLHLDLQHQVAAALQIEPEPDVLAEVVLQLGHAFREADDAEYAQQDCHNNDHGAPRQICLHGISEPFNRLLLLLHFRGDQAGNRAPRDLEFYVVGFHPQDQGLVLRSRRSSRRCRRWWSRSVRSAGWQASSGFCFRWRCMGRNRRK